MPPELSLDPELSSQHKHRLELSKSTKFPSKSLTILPDLKPSKNHSGKSPKRADMMLIKAKRKPKTIQDTYNMDTKTNWNQVQELPKIRDSIENNVSSFISRIQSNTLNKACNDSVVESESSGDEKHVKVHGNYEESPVKSTMMILASLRHDTPSKITPLKAPCPSSRSLLLKEEPFK